MLKRRGGSATRKRDQADITGPTTGPDQRNRDLGEPLVLIEKTFFGHIV